VCSADLGRFSAGGRKGEPSSSAHRFGARDGEEVKKNKTKNKKQKTKNKKQQKEKKRKEKKQYFLLSKM
jgi:chromosome condensin MukBEF MukE localization factor